jgi:hypothetical protein
MRKSRRGSELSVNQQSTPYSVVSELEKSKNLEIARLEDLLRQASEENARLNEEIQRLRSLTESSIAENLLKTSE